MRHYYYARLWNAHEEIIEMFETSFESKMEYTDRLIRKWPTHSIVVEEVEMREFLFLGRKFENAMEASHERGAEEVCNGA